ncbi:substrate-binding domain-containing protein [Poseidonibacter sp.]|uniref:substrate-binding domain-containing protein n=1 Tax=Poseidonibacter sp. TaxID=2321188 RepID=UPI003C76D011
MRKLIFVLCLVVCGFSSNIDEYILASEYYKNNPKEKISSNDFIKIVDNNAIPIEKNKNNPIKIYMIYPGKQVSDYWRRSKKSFEARLNELGIKYELIDFFTKPSVEINKQINGLVSALSHNSNYLIFTLDAKKHFKFISAILNEKNPKLILQNITTPLKNLNLKQPFLYVGFDHIIGAEMLAKQYIKEIGINGKYAVLYGSQGYVSQMRGDKFITYLNKNTNLKLVDRYYTDFNKEKAKLATYDLLENHKNLKFIYACSTDIALGVVEVLKEKGLLDKIKVNGWGGGSAELNAIRDKELDFTVMRMNDDNGVAMAEAIKLDLQNNSNKVPLIYSGDFKLVHKNMDYKEIEKLKDKAFRYSNK